MILSFKCIDKHCHEFEIDEQSNDTLLTYSDKILKKDYGTKFNLYKIKFIYKGALLNNEQTISSINYTNSSIIYFTSLKTEKDLDMVDILRVNTLSLLVFIRMNPQFMKMFENDFYTLMNVLTTNQIKPLFENIMNTNENANSDYLDILTDSIEFILDN